MANDNGALFFIFFIILAVMIGFLAVSTNQIDTSKPAGKAIEQPPQVPNGQEPTVNTTSVETNDTAVFQQ